MFGFWVVGSFLRVSGPFERETLSDCISMVNTHNTNKGLNRALTASNVSVSGQDTRACKTVDVYVVRSIRKQTKQNKTKKKTNRSHCVLCSQI